MWECFNMGTELPTNVMLGQTLVWMQMTFLNNVRKVGRLVLSRTSCLISIVYEWLCWGFGAIFLEGKWFSTTSIRRFFCVYCQRKAFWCVK
jgi:hypothetical protein